MLFTPEPGSPKAHDQDASVPAQATLVVSVNTEVKLKQTGGAVNAGIGFGLTVTVDLAESTQGAVPTTKITLYVPQAAYVCVGLIALEVPPSPKIHLYTVAGVTLVDVLVKPVGLFWQTVGAVNPAIGGLLTTTESVVSPPHPPFKACKVTV